MHILTEYHNSKSQERNAEYIYCIKKNIENPIIEGIHIFIGEDTIVDFIGSSQKVFIIRKKQRPTYDEFIRYAAENLDSSICIIANTDIVIAEGFEKLSKEYLEGKFISLSRWDSIGKKTSHYDFAYSQDAWVFLSPISISNSDFNLGILGCDNRIAYEAHSSGLDVRNPSGFLKVVHYHESNYRTYKVQDTLRGKYLFVYNTDNLDSVPLKIICDPATIGEAVRKVRTDRENKINA